MLGEIASIANAIASATNTAISAIRGRKPRGRPLFGQARTPPLSRLSIAGLAQRVAEFADKTSALLDAITNERLKTSDDSWSSWNNSLEELLNDIRTFNWYILNVYYPATFGILGRAFRADISVMLFHNLWGGPRSRWANWCVRFIRRHRTTKNMLLDLNDDLNALCSVGYRGKAFAVEDLDKRKAEPVELISELGELLIVLREFEHLLGEIIRSNWTLADFSSP